MGKTILSIGRLEPLLRNIANSPFFMKIVVIISFIYTYIIAAYTTLYNNVPIVRAMGDMAEDTWIDIKRLTTNQKYAPSDRLGWFNVVTCYKETLPKGNCNAYILEKYSTINDNNDMSLTEHYMDKAINMGIFDNSIEGPIIDMFFMVKHPADNFFVCRQLSPTTNNKYTGRKSRVRLLTAEYNHPSMKEPILFDIDNRYMREGNDIFSVGFVKRLLEYQSEPYIFDLSYKVTIMDDCMSTITIDSTQYLSLLFRKFEIKNTPKEERLNPKTVDTVEELSEPEAEPKDEPEAIEIVNIDESHQLPLIVEQKIDNEHKI